MDCAVSCRGGVRPLRQASCALRPSMRRHRRGPRTVGRVAASPPEVPSSFSGVTREELVQLAQDSLEGKAPAAAAYACDALAEALCTSAKSGVPGTAADLADRRSTFGCNTTEAAPIKTFGALLLEALLDRTLVVLMVAGATSFVLGLLVPSSGAGDDTWVEGAAVLGAVAIVASVTAMTNWQKERQFRALDERADGEVIVRIVRGGDDNVITVPVSDLVVGDVLLVGEGDIMPADAVMLTGSDVQVDESALTGESELKDKESACVLLSGSKVLSGAARVLVIAVGEWSQSGRIAAMVAAAGGGRATPSDRLGLESRTVLQQKLEQLALQIGSFGVIVGVGASAIAMLAFTYSTFVARGPQPWDWVYNQEYISIFITGCTIVVVSVPEGLPLAVTLALALSVRRMLDDGNLVRYLGACETMGSATIICTDKTGTLTTGGMSVCRLWTAGEEVPLSSVLEVDPAVRDRLVNAISFNSTASLIPCADSSGGFVGVGDRTETALLSFVQETLGANPMSVRCGGSTLGCHTFSSDRKIMTTVVAASASPRRAAEIYTKGAPEVVLERTVRVMTGDGASREMNDAEKHHLSDKYLDEWAAKGLRTLCLAYKELSTDNCDEVAATFSDAHEAERDLTLLGLVAIEDPLRPEVPLAVERCEAAGISVKIVTGDRRETAVSIAEQCGVLRAGDSAKTSPDVVMEGAEFRRRVCGEDGAGEPSQARLDEIWPRLKVLCRSTAADKYLLVSGIINSPRARQVVAVTGDGTNDAPALRRASVGFAMGVRGTDVAKEASDIIILNDKFSSIVAAVRYRTIQNFLTMQLTVNLAAVTVAAGGMLAFGSSPLSVVQLLWVNLLMDSLAGLAFASEAPSEALLDRPPVCADEPLLTSTIMRDVLGQSVLQLAILGWLILFGDGVFGVPPGSSVDGPSVHFTIVFNTFVWLQLFNQLNARVDDDEWLVLEGLWANPLFCSIATGEALIQSLITQYGGQVFDTVPLTAAQFAVCVAFGSLAMPWRLVLRQVPPARW